MNKSSKQIAQQLFKEIVQDYENEKMIKNGGFVQRTTSSEFLSRRL
ncbi:MAG: hypothetical protein J6B87_07590 [Clostridia bacterium]|nr:hypothetical protein [Clostridia bacterium]